MTVSFGSKIGGNYSNLESFRSRSTNNQTQPTSGQIESDEVKIEPSEQKNNTEKEIIYVEKQPKKTFFGRIRGFWAGIQKFFTGAVEYTKGSAKGIYYGSMAAVGVLAADGAVGAIKMLKAAKSGDAAKSAMNFFSKKGKIGAGVAAATVLGYQLFKSYLNFNEKKAQIDHRWQTGHDAE